MRFRIGVSRWGNCFRRCFYCMNPIGLKKVQVKMRCVQKYTYRAMTLPELLVVMIVGGIVFLMVFEAWNMAGRYGRQQTERSLSESTFFTAVPVWKLCVCRQIHLLSGGTDWSFIVLPEMRCICTGREIVWLCYSGKGTIVYPFCGTRCSEM